MVTNKATHKPAFNIENNGHVNIFTNGIKFKRLNANPNMTARHINIINAINGVHFINI